MATRYVVHHKSDEPESWQIYDRKESRYVATFFFKIQAEIWINENDYILCEHV